VCGLCKLNVCKVHLLKTTQNQKICDNCYKLQIVDSKEGAATGEQKRIEHVQLTISQQNEERESRIEKNRHLDKELAHLRDKLRAKAAECSDERKKLEEKLQRERERNAKVLSQVNNLKKALEDAKKAEGFASQKRNEAQTQLMLQSTELKLLKSQHLELITKLASHIAESKTIVHCRQFLLMACRDCKRRFTIKFREHMLRANFSVGNFSFNSTHSTLAIPRSSVAESEQDACKCSVM